MTAFRNLAGEGDAEEKGAETPDSTNNTSANNSGMYVVKRGDTLAGVALRLGVKQSELKRANHMYGSKTLVTGQLLKVDTVKSGSGTIVPPSTTPSADAFKPTAPIPAEEEVWFDDQLSSASPSETTFTGTAGAERSKHSSSPAWTFGDGSKADAGGFPDTTQRSAQQGQAGARGEVTGGSRTNVGMGMTDDPISTSPRASDADGTAPANGVSVRGVLQYMLGGSASPSPSPSAQTGSMFSEGAGETGPREGEASKEGEGLAATVGGWLHQRGSRLGSDASSTAGTPRAAAQALLSMVKPSYWRTGENEETATATASFDDVDHNNARNIGGTGERLEDNSPSAQAAARSIGALESEGRSVVADANDQARCLTRAHADAKAGTAVSEPPEWAAFRATVAGGDERDAPAPPLRKLPGLVAGGSTIVSHATLGSMEVVLPKHFKEYNWYLLFSTYRDGASYIQMYNKIKAEEPTFLIVESMEGEVFGGFATSAWASGCQYYGTGECFLFQIDGKRTTVKEDGDDDNDIGSPAARSLMEGDITTYQWTGMNTYLQYSDASGLGMGGGGAEGSFGLFIGEDFLGGSTGSCDTFCNPPLCKKKQFQISQVEVWGFTTADSEMGARLERLRKTLRGKTTRPL